VTTPTYPGVYIEEVPSEVRTITGVATSIAAFIGRARRGPVDDPVRVQSHADFARHFGGLWRESMMSYAVQHFFLNGGKDALIVRVVNPDGGAAADLTAQYTLDGAGGDLVLAAASPGAWGDNLEIVADHDTREEADPANPVLFNLRVREVVDGQTVQEETFRNVSSVDGDPRFVTTVLEQQSSLLRVQTANRPDESALDAEENPAPAARTRVGSDGDAVGFDQIAHPDLADDRRGLWALDRADLFNILCLPPFDRDVDIDEPTWSAALAYCELRRAMLIIDPPASWGDPAAVQGAAGVDGALPARHRNAAVYFPRVRMADPLQENRLETFVPCGAIAGVWARTDAQRGVWKAPAGQDATLLGVRDLSYRLTDGENGQLNPLGVNCLRRFPVTGHVAWGARTLVGADRLASEWKYLPVRRLALFLEESLYRATRWVIFEPNDEPLWAQIRLNVGAFMHDLFRQGAFQGTTPRDAYFVKCDGETTTQSDVNRGIVNLLVGFAPLKPAEFLIIRISQIAGDIQT
jgi:uncharacterized protein